MKNIILEGNKGIGHEMDHKKHRNENTKRIDVKQFSDIEYSVDNRDALKIQGAGNRRKWKFDPLTGKVVLSILVKMDIQNTGVNIATLYSTTDDKVLEINTEGAYFYAYDGKIQHKLCHFN